MKYLPVDIRVGAIGLRRIGSSKLKFYDKIVKLIFPEERKIEAINVDSATLISPHQYTCNPFVICSLLEDEIHRFPSTPLDLLLIDFTSNSLVYTREPLLSPLAETLVKMVSNKECKKFLILLSELPGAECTSSQLFESINQIDSKASVVVLSNSGKYLNYSNTLQLPKNIKKDYIAAFIELYGSADAQLEKRCIRRLGHFTSNNGDHKHNVCRIYSYLLHDCDDALKTLFSEWWAKHGKNCKAIVYDLKNNVAFRDIVEAFGDDNGIMVSRVEDVLKEKELCASLREVDECILVLDVVEKGASLKKHIEQLNQAGINISSNVVTAINKHGDKNSTVGDYHVHGFLARSSELHSGECVQCILELPYTSDQKETFLKIRSFDMMYMAHKVGWEPEPESPNVKTQYKRIPKFSGIISEYGDWLAYKIKLLITSENFPDNWFIIQPEEIDSTALSSKIQNLYDNKLCIVKVPRPALKMAKDEGNVWDNVIKKYSEDYWTKQLNSLSSTAALMLDIFNASGSTKRSLNSLLKYYQLNPCGYICFVDFNPKEVGTDEYGITKYSLYDWDNPRTSA